MDTKTRLCPLQSSKQMSKCERRKYNFQYDGKVYMCRWNGGSVVTLASNYDIHEPMGKVKGICHKEKNKVDVSQPHLIKGYNEGMGGVDLLDFSEVTILCSMAKSSIGTYSAML